MGQDVLRCVVTDVVDRSPYFFAPLLDVSLLLSLQPVLRLALSSRFDAGPARLDSTQVL